MKRTLFYNKLAVDNIEELDFLYNSLSNFTTEYEVDYYRVTSADIPDPYIISYKCYGVGDFWWILLAFNGIENPFTDLVEGTLLKVPNKLDIYSFQKKFRLRKS